MPEQTAPTVTIVDKVRRKHPGHNATDEFVKVDVTQLENSSYFVEVSNVSAGVEHGFWHEEFKTPEEVRLFLKGVEAGAFPKYVNCPKEWQQ